MLLSRKAAKPGDHGDQQTCDLIPRLPPPVCGRDLSLTLSEPVFPTENWAALGMALVGCQEHGLRRCSAPMHSGACYWCPQVVLWRVPQRPVRARAECSHSARPRAGA